MAHTDDDRGIERAKTDKSLRDERAKTDEHLERRRKSVEQETADSIHADRQTADEERTRQRADIDQLTAGYSSLGEQALQAERERSDEAIKLERQLQDGALQRERFQKRLIAEALLATERRQTDKNLRGERDRADLAAAGMASRLSDEEQAHLVTKEALAQRDQALSIVSHDLKNPAVAMMIGVHLIRKRLTVDPIDRSLLLKDLTILEQSAIGIDRMVSDLLDVQKIEHGKLPLHIQRGDVCVLLQECVNLFTPIVTTKSCSLVIDMCTGPVWASFDHDRLLQVLSNLLGNAIKFTPAGGTITLSAWHDHDRVFVAVSDNGPGIAEQDRSKLFRKFSQVHARKEGLGLGLFIAKSIVEEHGGQIVVESAVGQGSTFRFSLATSVGIQ
jgi:signal transduction histidine kinase